MTGASTEDESRVLNALGAASKQGKRRRATDDTAVLVGS